MSKWSHADGYIYCRNLDGVKTLITSQKLIKRDYGSYYTNLYISLEGSEGDAHFEYDKDRRVLDLRGDLRDVGTIPEIKNLLLKDFKDIIKLVDGCGYIQLEYENEGTIVVDYYGEYDTRIFPDSDGWSKWYEWRQKEGLDE